MSGVRANREVYARERHLDCGLGDLVRGAQPLQVPRVRINLQLAGGDQGSLRRR